MTDMETNFKHYFSLEEAVSLLPFLNQTFQEAHQELATLKDQVVLYKRLLNSREEEGFGPNDPETKSLQEVLQKKWHVFETCYNTWLAQITDKGIQVRNMETGLIDFPYQSEGGETFFLCWQLGEEGLFYFHDLTEGFSGRKPISLLPE